MSERCERCKKGFAAGPPKDDVEWHEGMARREPLAERTAPRRLRVGRCTRCNLWFVDLWTDDAVRPGHALHDLCTVQHEAARAALLEGLPAALAAVSTQLRRRHAEELVARMSVREQLVLERIEQGVLPSTELFRGLVTHANATSGRELPSLGDVRPRPLPGPRKAAAVGLRGTLELGEGARLAVEPEAEGVSLARLRGDAVAWKVALPTGSREVFVARALARGRDAAVVLAGSTAEPEAGQVFVVELGSGAVSGPGRHGLRPAAFDVLPLASGCTFVAGYQSALVLREDASVLWQANALVTPSAVPLMDAVAVIDVPWRLVVLELPTGRERCAARVDRNAVLMPSGEGHVLAVTTDVVTRLDLRGADPVFVWGAHGTGALPLGGGGAAVVRERTDKSGRHVECVVLDAGGRRRFAITRTDGLKMPLAELGPGVLLFHANSDVAVTVNDRVAYALALPDGQRPGVTLEPGGVWIEYDGIVDRLDGAGRRVGRWRVG